MRTSLISICLLATMLGCGGTVEPITVGSTVPDFSLPNLAGGTFTRDQLPDKPTILNFWATWCAPCKKEIPDLQEIHAAGMAEVIGIALDERGAAKVEPFVAREKIEYPILIGNAEIFRRFEGLHIPHTVILDREQRVVAVHKGLVPKEKLEADLRGL